MQTVAQAVRAQLLELADESYKRFQSKLLPTVPEESILGVRVPVLRRFARQFAKKPECNIFLQQLPHETFDENNLHAFLIETISDFSECIRQLERFLPFIDNWATCDCLSAKALGQNRTALLPYIQKWMHSDQLYTVRFGIGALQRYYLDAEFDPEYLTWVAAVQSDEYYINMMCAWFFATALAKHYRAALPFLEEQRLPGWTHNKAIQKAIESRRISASQKDYLRTLRIKNERHGRQRLQG